MGEKTELTGYPSIDKPWLKYYSEEEISAPLPARTIYEYLWENNRDHLNDTALNYYGRKIKYHELFENIDKTARAFSAIGVKQGDTVMIVSVTLPEIVYALYALNRLGAIPDMVDPRTSTEGIRDYIIESCAKVVTVIDVAAEKIVSAAEDTCVSNIIVISPSHSLPVPQKMLYRLSNTTGGTITADKSVNWRDFITAGKNVYPEYAPYRNDRCCVIVHTGGTTGTPKGVMLSDDCLNNSVVQSLNSGFDFQRHHKWLGIMPPFIAYGLINGLHFPLVRGMVLIIIPRFDPDRYDRLLIKHRPNHMVGVPSHYSKIIESKRLQKKDLSFIISPIIGGDRIDEKNEAAVQEFLHSHSCQGGLIKGYGMTEVCAAVCTTAVKETNKLGSVGIPLSHSVVSVFDEGTGRELHYGEIGEICILSPNTMIGYFGRKAETEKILKKHVDGRIWVHSGDLGYMDEDGCLFIVGRLKRLIIRHDGFKIFPTLIESVIAGHDAVSECCAVGIKDREYSQGCLPVVYIVLMADFSGQEDQVRKELFELCGKELPEYEQPVGFIFRKGLPLTPIGKIDYSLLEKEAAIHV